MDEKSAFRRRAGWNRKAILIKTLTEETVRDGRIDDAGFDVFNSDRRNDNHVKRVMETDFAGTRKVITYIGWLRRGAIYD